MLKLMLLAALKSENNATAILYVAFKAISAFLTF